MNFCKRVSQFFFLCSFILLFAVACQQTAEPEIDLEVQVVELMEEDYEYVEFDERENANREDFRKFTLHLKMEHSEYITERTFSIPDGKQWIDTVNQQRYQYGLADLQLTNDQKDAHYVREFVFYSKDLSNEEIRSAFDSMMIKVSWVSHLGDMVDKEFVISELLEISVMRN